MLGSVSTNLIHHAACPVLVVKDEAAPLRRITLAIDGSSASAKALEFVVTKFQPDSSTGKGGRVPIQVTVIHVMPFIKYPELKEAGRRMVEQSARKLVKAGFTAEGPKGWARLPGSSSGAFRREWSSTVPARYLS
jgi:hypothetical protein